jgi:hypothetical protein
MKGGDADGGWLVAMERNGYFEEQDGSPKNEKECYHL